MEKKEVRNWHLAGPGESRAVWLRQGLADEHRGEAPNSLEGGFTTDLQFGYARSFYVLKVP